MNKDLSIMIEDTKLNIRVGAVIEYQDKILIEKNKTVDFSVIPGGRIKTLENSHTAILREITEELGIDLSKEKFELISLIENFFIFNNTKYHELYFVYKVKLEKEYNIKNGITNLDTKDSNYYLLNQEELQKENMKPTILKEVVFSNTFKHYIVEDIH